MATDRASSNRSTGSRVENYKGFLPNMGMPAILVM